MSRPESLDIDRSEAQRQIHKTRPSQRGPRLVQMASHDNGMLETSRMFKAGNFPSWARPGLGGRGRTSYPKPLTRDRLKPISKETIPRRPFELMDGRSVADITHQKLAQREKDISFLKTQHRDVLRGLHSEIERLKAENKDLQFKLVMRKGKEDEEELGRYTTDQLLCME